MKRTTYILIGLLVAGLGVIITTIVGVSLWGKGYEKADVYLGGEKVEMSLEGVRAVDVFVSQNGVRKSRHITLAGGMTITNSPEPGRTFISYSKNKHLKVSKKENTLYVKFDFSESSLPEKDRNKDRLIAMGLELQLMADTTLTEVNSNVNGLWLNFKDMRADSLCVRTDKQNVLLDSCQFRSFDMEGYRLHFQAKNSTIENFYLNLDHVWHWSFTNSKVGTEYLSGRGHHTNDLQKGECCRVVWTPLKEDARLEMKILEKAEIIISPE